MTEPNGEAPRYIRYLNSSPREMRTMIAVNPIAYVPIGALEWHGEHAALGLDSIKAQALCEKAAAISGGVVFPSMDWGAFNTMRYPFTFHFPKRALRRQVRATIGALADWGFRSIVLVTGHYPLAQVRMLRKECRRLTRRSESNALGIPDSALGVDFGYLGDHAAKWETSLLMAIDPSLVDLSRLPDDTGSLWRRGVDHGIYGICPKKHANAKLGKKALDLMARRLADVASTMLRADANDAIEGVYRDYDAAFKRPIKAGRKAFGVKSTWAVIRFSLGNLLRNRHL